MGDASLDPIGRIWALIGMNAPSLGGRGGGGGAFAAFAGAGSGMATTGDYLVTLVVNGQSYKQTFRVERVSGGEDGPPQFGDDERHDSAGRFVRSARKKSK
jgi:hypothetical protein